MYSNTVPPPRSEIPGCIESRHHQANLDKMHAVARLNKTSRFSDWADPFRVISVYTVSLTDFDDMLYDNKVLPPPHSLAQHQLHSPSRFYWHLPPDSARTDYAAAKGARTLSPHSCPPTLLAPSERSGYKSDSKHWFTTSFLQPLPYLVTP